MRELNVTGMGGGGISVPTSFYEWWRAGSAYVASMDLGEN